MIHRSAHLIANNISPSADLPCDIGSGVILRKPTAEELTAIRRLLPSISSTSLHMSPYEALITQREDGGVTYNFTDNSDDWHYYVLSDDEGGSRVYELEPALLLIDPCVEISIRIISEVEGSGEGIRVLGHGGMMPHIFERYHYGVPIRGPRLTLSIEKFLLAENIRKNIESLNPDYDFVKRAVKMWQELRRVSESSRLQVIGLFSIIESLITHSPRLAESLDSISHQLSGKLRLMTNRMECSNILTHAFGNTAPANVWKKLYSYRSSIAHGNAVEFDGEFRVLRSNEVVANFLFSFTRNLLLQALSEPQLFYDLKEC